MELTLAQSLYISKEIFSMIYLSLFINPYAVHSPVPHSLIQSLYLWPYTDGSHDDKPVFNHLAQCLSLLNPLPQCISSACPCLHICSLNLMCFSCQLDEPYGFSDDHLQNAAMLQCVSRYLQSIFVTVSLYSVGNKTYYYCYYCYYVYDRGCWHMYIDTTPGSVPSKASSSSCLLAEGKTSLFDWFELVCNFAQICAVQIVVEANTTWKFPWPFTHVKQQLQGSI